MNPYDDNYTDRDDDLTPHNPYSEPRDSGGYAPLRRDVDYDPADEGEESVENEENDDNEENDYFNTTDPAPVVKKPKPAKIRPDDPRYWEGDGRWDHLKPCRKTRFYLWLVGAAVVAGAVVALWLRYFSPYITEATQYGYIENIEKRGMLFKTYEGTLIPYKELMDTTRIYSRDFVFTADNVKIATELKRAELAHRPVRVEYKRYFGTLPWRGASQIIVTAVDSVNPRDILPPEFRPETLR